MMKPLLDACASRLWQGRNFEIHLSALSGQFAEQRPRTLFYALAKKA
jgi:hypothetical protein